MRTSALGAREDTSEEGIGTAISFAHVTVVCDRRRLLDDLTFEVPLGVTVALLGPPGAGKTTAIETGLGVRRIDGGVIRLLGLGPAVAIASGRVGAALSSWGLPGGARVRELLGFVRALHHAPLSMDDLVDRAGLESLMDRPTDRLSLSQARRLRFALALAGDPDLLFLDDPDRDLDLQALGDLRTNLERLRDEGRTLLLATRDADLAASSADRVIVLERGRLRGERGP